MLISLSEVSKNISSIMRSLISIALLIVLGCSEVTASPTVSNLTVQDLVRGCKPQLSIPMRFPNATKAHKTILTLSTPSVIHDQLIVMTDSGAGVVPLPCLYHGVNTETQEAVFGHVNSGFLSARFKSNGLWYHATKWVHSTEVAVPKPIEIKEDDFEMTSVLPPPAAERNSRSLPSAARPSSRKRRSLKLEAFNDGATKKVLELMLVAESDYSTKFGSGAIPRMMEIVNYVNGVYQAFGLRVVLKSAIVLSSNPFSMAQSVDDILREFGVYKALNIKIRHDAAILLTPNIMNKILAPGVTQTATTYSWTGGLCQLVYSNGLVADLTEPVNAAWLVAHSIGALLGFSNVEDVSGCTCPSSNGCIMNYILDSSFRGLLNWSSCAWDTWRNQVDAIWRSCLRDAPDAAFSNAGSTGSCGNGVVEAGEQCDCGPSLTCRSACCNPSTCMFTAGSECASGSCCNSTTCRLKQRGQVCRDADGPCDVAETCDGSTEWCPPDDKVHDGVECSPGVSFCYNGECKSSLKQCRALFGPSAVVAPSTCFTGINMGTNSGFCHWSLIFMNVTTRRYTFSRCSSMANAMCGLLHCTLPTKPAIGNTYNLLDGSNCSSNSDQDFSSSGLRDPSMVPDGAFCGSQYMCVNSSCQPVSRFACTDCPDCHGNGVPTKNKLCYCKPGFAPPDCSSTGCGGSLQSPCDRTALTSPMPTTTITAPIKTTTTTSTVPTTTSTVPITANFSQSTAGGVVSVRTSDGVSAASAGELENLKLLSNTVMISVIVVGSVLLILIVLVVVVVFIVKRSSAEGSSSSIGRRPELSPVESVIVGSNNTMAEYLNPDVTQCEYEND